MSEFDPINCPVGIKNCAEIDKVKDKLDMAIERLEEKIGDMKEDLTTRMNEGFSNVEEKLDTLGGQVNSLDSRITTMDGTLDARIDARIDTKLEIKKGKAAASAWKWILTGFCIPIAIAVITAVIKNLFNI